MVCLPVGAGATAEGSLKGTEGTQSPSHQTAAVGEDTTPKEASTNENHIWRLQNKDEGKSHATGEDAAVCHHPTRGGGA